MNVANDSARLQAIHRYDILDTPPDGTFDGIALIASRIFDVPIAIVSIVDEDRIWFKSHHGIDVAQVNREPGLCASAILKDDPTVILDARQDVRCLANSLVAGEFGLRFYAAAPLITSDGHKLGTLCVIDKQPRQVSAAQMDMLKILAAIVVDELELRLAARKLARIAQDLHQGKALAEQRYRQAFDHAPIGMVLLSADLMLLEVNAAFCEMLGHTESELLLKSFLELVAKSDIERCEAAFANLAAESANSHKVELRFFGAAGELLVARVTLAAILDTSNCLVRLIAQVEASVQSSALTK